MTNILPLAISQAIEALLLVAAAIAVIGLTVLALPTILGTKRTTENRNGL